MIARMESTNTRDIAIHLLNLVRLYRAQVTQFRVFGNDEQANELSKKTDDIEWLANDLYDLKMKIDLK